MSKLAIHGGENAKKTPYGTGRRFGKEELLQLEEALEQDTLFYWHGGKVKEFTQKFAAMYGSKHCVAASSCSAAIHTALGALGVTAGDEVITTPITDMGTVIGILYQNAIPVFADLQPHTYNIDPKSLEEKITDRTKAVVVVHLAGNPADMDAVMEVARRRGVKVVEDCAQSYLCTHKGRLAGTFGDIGCFSTNDYKHISTGDGGMLIMDDEAVYQRAMRFADKNYDRLSPDPAAMRNIAYIAPNYRMTELQGAVGIAQLDRLASICERRHRYGDGLTKGIAGLPGIYPPEVREGNECSYWFYMLRIDEREAGVPREVFCEALRAEGVNCSAGYIPACVYEYDLFRNKSAYEGTDCPFGCRLHGRAIEYKTGICPVSEEILATAVKLPVSEFYTEQDLEETVEAIKKVSEYYSR